MTIAGAGAGDGTGGSPSSSSSSAVSNTTASYSAAAAAAAANPDSSETQSWWESISKARARIRSLADILSLPDLAALSDSPSPARSLLDSPDAYAAVSAALSHPSSGSGDDPLCQWLYDTFLCADPELRPVVLSYLPLVAGIYMHRVIRPGPLSLAGFEPVLLAVYGAEAQARNGKPLLVSVPDLSQPSFYHTPSPSTAAAASSSNQTSLPSVGILSPPLEPPDRGVKSTKRACIVAVCLECYYKKISLMPSRSKVDFCDFVASWCGQDCLCRFEFDDEGSPFSPCSSSSSSPGINTLSEDAEIGNVTDEMGSLCIRDQPNGHCDGKKGGNEMLKRTRIPLPWELLQPVMRILGHCLLGPVSPQEVRDAASVAVRCVYARALHDLLPQAILAAHSLIQLDKSARRAAKDVAMAAAIGSVSNPNTPSKLKKPEVFLASK